MALYADAAAGTEVGAMLSRLAPFSQDRVLALETVRTALSEAYYGVLLALDGTAALGGVQQQYFLRGEDGHELSGDLEGAAWEALMADRKRGI